ncbi:uncharacterized protein LOC26527220 [Drosophila mojavensis]|uniref:F-box domain-containing protein n=1 Tax=Drosophila mojavensis TaxID=7230 RepID=A0A0Q9XGK5_DROMO|nr:uncharacterized protein LOC26527220 [Drosophila mojavensis]KRG02627.1 uncharacterized protein Dmoj_GI25579 [Drosophila mojavensis]
MENLNDDVQLRIINYLEFLSQFWLWVASKDVAPRTYDNVSYAWQGKTSHKLQYRLFKEFEKYDTLVEVDFIRAISPTVKHLELYRFSISNLTRWRGQCFPCMESLYYAVDFITHWEHKEALKLIVELFPKLKSLKSPSYINGRIIEKLTDLQILDLSESFLYFIEFDSINGILNLPKLQSFSFYTEPHETESIMNEIFERRGQDIRKFLASALDIRFLVNKGQCLKNLRLLTLCSAYYERDEFESLVSNMPALEELNLVDCAYWQLESDLWRTVANCRSLKILGLSIEVIDEDFFDSSRLQMEYVLSNHLQPLILNFYQTDDDVDVPSILHALAFKYFNHSNLTYCFKQHRDIIICRYLTKIEFC